MRVRECSTASRVRSLRALDPVCAVEKVNRSLVHLRDTYPRRKKIARELKYFRHNRHRMRYAALKEQGLPIGSGVTEAACKTLATQRMKRSGMRWGEQGGQAILSFRALVQSNRFERAWTLLAHLQGGGYDSRQCRADTQLAMIGVSMRVTPFSIRAIRGALLPWPILT